jgi:hypothetical protein
MAMPTIRKLTLTLTLSSLLLPVTGYGQDGQRAHVHGEAELHGALSRHRPSVSGLDYIHRSGAQRTGSGGHWPYPVTIKHEPAGTVAEGLLLASVPLAGLAVGAIPAFKAWQLGNRASGWGAQ